MISGLISSFIDLDDDNRKKLLKYANVIINPIKIYLIILNIFLIILIYYLICINYNIVKCINNTLII